MGAMLCVGRLRLGLPIFFVNRVAARVRATRRKIATKYIATG